MPANSTGRHPGRVAPARTETSGHSSQVLAHALRLAGYTFGEVFELCALGKGGRSGGPEARRFCVEDEGVAAAVAWASGQAARLARAEAAEGGVYLGSNPLASERGGRARDEDAARVRLLLVDLDPVDAAPAARDAAAGVAEAVRALLRERLGVEPVLVNSGRGRQLWLRHESVAAGDERAARLRRALLEALAARFDGPLAHVDRSVHNASRLMRAPGWPNLRTGEVAAVLDAGDGGVATLERLEALVADLTRERAAAEPAEDDDEDDGGPPFPLAVLPRRTREVVAAFARAVNADVALAAAPAMAVASAALGPKWRAGVPSYHRSALVWPLVAAPSASGKSPGRDAALEPAWALDRRHADEHALVRDEAERAARTAPRGEREAARVALAELTQRRRFVVSSATPEALVAALGANAGEPLVWSADEVRRLLGEQDGYRASGGGIGRATLLELFDGRAIRQLRVGREAVEVDAHHVSITGGVQPGVVAALDLAAADGLFARFSWFLAERRPTGGLGVAAPPEAATTWARLFGALRAHVALEPQLYDPAGRDLLDRVVSDSRSASYDLERAGLALRATVAGRRGEHVVRWTALFHGLDRAELALEDGGGATAAAVPASTVERALALVGWTESNALALVGRACGESAGSGDLPTGDDGDLAVALLGLLAPGEAVTLRAGELLVRLRAAAPALAAARSASALGKALARLENLGPAGLAVEQAERQPSGRRWRLARAR